MLNLLKNTKPWMVASLLVATSVFGQDRGSSQKDCKPCPKPACPPACPQPTPPTQMCPPAQNPCCAPWPVPVLNAAYNYPARTLTRCPWDIYFDASFIYWQPLEENIEVGSVTTATGSSTVINGSDSFKPGFQVGMGGNFDYDNWDLHAEYTWFHNTHTNSISAGAGETINPGFAGEYTSASRSWRLRMDIADLDLGRWHYTGTKFTCRPSVGARGAWIRQRLETAAVGTDTQTVTRKSTSWAVGPKVAVDTNWVLGEGFRFYGNAEGDILFTRYNRLSTSFVGTFEEDPVDRTVSQRHYNTLRTHLDIELGFGWGTYVDCNNWYMDFSAGYGFQVFFDQNMFRHFSLDTTSFVPSGNLYIQGLTARFRLDF